MKFQLCVGVAVLLAQVTTTPQFEVASVKVHTQGGGTTRRIEQQNLTYLNITLGEFIQMAYGVKRYQVQGEDWITNNASRSRYDIIAKAATATTDIEMRKMLLPVLEERFHLKVHRETRVLPIYVLVQAKSGSKLNEGNGGEQYVTPDRAGGFRFQNYPMSAFVNTLSAMPTVGRPVIDRTGLAGRYTFTANLQELPTGAPPDDLKSAVAKSDATVFGALEDQLGLKLMPERQPIEIVVVDQANRIPTED